MPHPFADKLFIFIGNPTRCSRQSARDALVNVGGVPEERYSVYTHYTVAFSGAEKTKLYEKAVERDRFGQTVMLTEDQFFNVLEGKVVPPERKQPPRDPNVIVFPPKDPAVQERAHEEAVSDAVSRKRLTNMARYGVSMLDGSRMKADLRPLDMAIRFDKFVAAQIEQFRKGIAVTLETLKSKPINEKAVIKGLATYNVGDVVEYQARSENEYQARVSDEVNMRTVILEFTRDGLDLKSYSCGCSTNRRSGLVCKHIVAAVLAIQGGVAETKVTLGKTATVITTVDMTNTAKAVGSGSLDVFATPMMIALMERAACEVLNGSLASGQTSVGTSISVNHTAASPVGATISATATIISVSGRKIDFDLSASDGDRKIGDGKHTRMIVENKKFMERLKK